MNYDNVAPEGKVCCCIFWVVLTQSLAEEDGGRPVMVVDCDQTSFSPAIVSPNQKTLFVISYAACESDRQDGLRTGRVSIKGQELVKSVFM